jgi:hypothetical protein
MSDRDAERFTAVYDPDLDRDWLAAAPPADAADRDDEL